MQRLGFIWTVSVTGEYVLVDQIAIIVGLDLDFLKEGG